MDEQIAGEHLDAPPSPRRTCCLPPPDVGRFTAMRLMPYLCATSLWHH